MNSYFKIFGLTVDNETGKPDWGFSKVNIDITVEQFAKMMCLDPKIIVKITEEEYEEDADD